LRQRARTRRTRIIATISAAITAISTGFGSFATYQQHRIEESYEQIQIEQSEFLARESGELLAAGDRYQAVQVALSALPLLSASPDRPFVPSAQLALEQSLGIYPGSSDWMPLYSQTGLADRGLDAAFSSNGAGLEAVFTDDAFLEVRESTTGNTVSRIGVEELLGTRISSSTVYAAVEFAGDDVLVVLNGVIGCFDAESGDLLWKQEVDGISYNDCSLAVSPDGTRAAVSVEFIGGRDGLPILVIDVASGETVQTIDLPGYATLGLEATSFYEDPVVAFSPDGTHLAVGVWGRLFWVDLETGSFEQRALHFDAAYTISFVDGIIAVFARDSSGTYTKMPTSLEVFDAETLALLWERDAVYEANYNLEIGADYYTACGVYGTWSYHGGDDTQLVVLFANELLLLDEKTGEEVLSIPSTSGYLDCLVTEARGRQRIFATMSDGTVICRRPLESNSGKGGTVADTVLFDRFPHYSDLYEIDGRVYCSEWTAIADKRVVYRFSTPDDLVESYTFSGATTNDLMDFSWTDPVLALRTKTGIILVDGETMKVRTIVPYERMHGLDTQYLSSMESMLDSAGNVFLLGDLRAGDGGTEGSVIYRIDGADGSATELATFDPGLSVELVDFIDTPAGAVGLVVQETGFSESFVEVIPLGEVEPLRVAIPRSTKVWFAGERIICFSNQSTAEHAFTLIDALTGEELETDLANYAMPIDAVPRRCASISPDGLFFAVSCSDGALRMFDTVTGTMVWETFDAPSSIQFLKLALGGNVFIQDGFGRCVLVSGLTGTVLDASSAAIPPIDTAVFRNDGATLTAYFKEAGMNGAYGLVEFSLAEESLGPLSIIYNAYYLSPGDGGYILSVDDYTGELIVSRKLSLDEELLYGRELVIGHELTAAERQLYQTGDRDAIPIGDL
ncbi:MAG: PQQ-binding-like beta-propeller repeat protein, partial [Atopobiaceae bacterium]|nr:PQQ-binding-like beta-propeller repeat protein [Atopobiaceae bacterium]